MFSNKDRIRYSRHIAIPEFGLQGQKRLSRSRVLVVGAGGLGSPLLTYLVAAGIGHIGIIDPDVVDLSNLHRQVIYSIADIGRAKVEASRESLLKMNPGIDIKTFQQTLSTENALDLFANYDIIADGTDNFPTRYLVNDACVLAEKINVYASIYRFEGQVSVFNYLDKDGVRGPNYRDLFPKPPDAGTVPNCAEGGVIGALAGIIGAMQALEVIKIASGVGEPLSGRLLLYDGLSFTSRILNFSKNPDTRISKLINYEHFCGSKSIEIMSEVKEITVSELKDWKDSGKDFQLIDCREQYEYDFCNLEGELIPLGDIITKVDKISKDKDVVIHCRSGQRSATAILNLQEQMGLTKLYNLKGGILAWSAEIDPSIPSY